MMVIERKIYQKPQCNIVCTETEALLVHASGKAKRASYDMVMSFGRMSEPLTKVQKVDSTTTAKSYNFAYKYEDSNHPTAPTQIGHDYYTYDSKGCPMLELNSTTNGPARCP